MNTATQPPAAGQAAHTPTPWHVSPYSELELRGKVHIRSMQDGHGGLLNIATCTPANAAFIVRACNSHAALVAALDFLLSLDINALIDVETTKEPYAERKEREIYLAGELAKARAALAQAKESAP